MQIIGKTRNNFLIFQAIYFSMSQLYITRTKAQIRAIDDSLEADVEERMGLNLGNKFDIPSNVDTQLEAKWAHAADAPMLPNGSIPLQRLGNTNYTIFRRSVNWYRAHSFCVRAGKILATFPTPESYDEVADIIFKMSVFDPSETAEYMGSRRYWFGMSDHGGEGEWRWMDTGTKVTYMRFYQGQPDHIYNDGSLTHPQRVPGKPGAHCGLMWNPQFQNGEKHVWDDSECIGDKRYYYFICEEFKDKIRVV